MPSGGGARKKSRNRVKCKKYENSNTAQRNKERTQKRVEKQYLKHVLKVENRVKSGKASVKHLKQWQQYKEKGLIA